MARNVQLVLLCEDTQQEAFARRFLNKAGWSTRRMRVERGQSGSAEQFVRERYPMELGAYRSKAHQVDQALIVLIDGDNRGVAGRLDQLAAACRGENVEPRKEAERVAVFVPTWNIEAWFAYLDGTNIDEAQGNYPRLDRARECQRHVNALHEMCQQGSLRQPTPPSFDAACKEYGERLK